MALLKLILTYSIFLLGFQHVFGQTKSITIDDNHGKIAIDVGEYNSKYNNRVLDVGKYLDTSKQIVIVAGSIVMEMVILRHLKSDYAIYPFGGKHSPSIFVLPGGEKIISLRFHNGKLQLTSDIDGLDGKYIAKIRNNELIPSKLDYHLYASDRYFELFDDYYVPILQVELVKKENAIYIDGVFAHDRGYNILSEKRGLQITQFEMPYLLMSQARKDSIIFQYKEDTKVLVPIHE
jgi:hypothetical protein